MQVKTTIVIPCYNEGLRLSLPSFDAYMQDRSAVGFRFVDDGSTDNTAERLAELKQALPDCVECLSLPENSGKAEAVRQGVQEALSNDSSEYIGYWDADLATPLEEIDKLLRAAEATPQYRFICGSRVQRMGANVERHWHRHYFGRFLATLVSSLLRLPFYDTQCGAKLMRREVARDIFDRRFISPWLFDVELIARMMDCYGRDETAKSILEVPLAEWRDVGESKVKLSYLPRIPYELWKISRSYLLLTGGAKVASRDGGESGA